MSAQHTPGPKARYKVEHCDTRGVWVPMHRGTLKRYSDALAKKQAFCRVMADYSGNGVWEEVETMPRHTEAWEAEKRAMAVKEQAIEIFHDVRDGLTKAVGDAS